MGRRSYGLIAREGWYPLNERTVSGVRRRVDRRAPKRLRGFAPPFLSAVPEPGIVQLMDRAVRRKRGELEAFSCAAGQSAGSLAFDLYEGIVESDRWFGPLFTTLRAHQDDVPDPFQHRDTAPAVSRFTEVPTPTSVEPLQAGRNLSDFPPEEWSRYEEKIGET